MTFEKMSTSSNVCAEKRPTGVSWSTFFIVVVFLCLACVAVGLGVYFGVKQPEVKGQHGDHQATDDPAISPLVEPTGNFRLPTAFRPSLYVLSLQPYFPAGNGLQYLPDKNFTFDGNVTIFIDCLLTADNITLNMNRITLDNSSVEIWDVSESSQRKLPFSHYVYDQQSEKVSFFLNDNQQLMANRSYRLSMSYSGRLEATDLSGFYPSSYMENGVLRWLVVTQFEPTDARKALPCFDEPSFKAYFEVTIVHPSNMVALSNSMDNSTVDLQNGWNRTTFERTLKMSTYLLAFAVCAFESKVAHTADNRTLFRVWARPSQIDSAAYAVVAGPKVLDYYTKYFGIPFPLKKQDMLALPDFSAGAMENWGLVTYRETALLYNDTTSSSAHKQRVAVVIAHELAHQWFGDLVTMEWWNDLWLNEGFACYMEHIGSDVIGDNEFHMDQQITITVRAALSLDQLPSSHPIFVKVETPNEISAIFDTISYNKGASIIRMLRFTTNEQIMSNGLNKYLSNHEYGNANHNDLWAALTDAVGDTIVDWNGQRLNVSLLMNPWLLQTGYPLITVTRQYNSNGQSPATVTQERFLLPDTTNGTGSVESWPVPLRYINQGETKPTFTWIKPNGSATLNAATDQHWLLANYEAAGYFRVNYDERNWNLIMQQLQTDFSAIEVNSRAQLLDDVFTMARSDRTSYKTALDMTVYLKNETEFLPFRVFIDSFRLFADLFTLTSDFEPYSKYVQKVLKPAYERLGWDDKLNSKESVLIHYLRSLAISNMCQLDYSDCTEQAQTEFASMIKSCSSGNAVSSSCSMVAPNLRKPVYCAGGKKLENWDFLWKLHAAEQVAVEKENLLYGLSCTTSPNLLLKLLDESINKNSTIIRLQDSSAVFAYVSYNEIGNVLLWDYVVKNWQTIHELFKNSWTLSKIISSATRTFNAPHHVKTLQNFYNTNAALLGTADRSFRQEIERVQSNVDWMKNHQKTVAAWFRNAGATSK